MSKNRLAAEAPWSPGGQVLQGCVCCCPWTHMGGQTDVVSHGHSQGSSSSPRVAGNGCPAGTTFPRLLGAGPRDSFSPL